MKQNGAEEPGTAAVERACVDCVCDALSERADAVSREELRRASKRLTPLAGVDDGIIREMARNLARRIVDSPMRRLLRASARDRARMVAEIRETFGLDEPEGCTLARPAGRTARMAPPACFNADHPPRRRHGR
ncbi:MAG: hypothetical protein ACE5FC_05970 [Myxococcota bacterium]